MAKKKHLIIGSGPAALSALEAIRRVTFEDEVKLVTMSEYQPYSPASLPYLLAGRITEADLWTKDESYFRNLKSSLVTGKEVAAVQTAKKRVVYRDGSSERYDTLLIASGAEPVRPQIEGLDEAGYQNFTTLSDCRRLLRELEHKKEIAVLGAGMVGMKIAAALLERGCRVAIIEKEPAILPRYFDEEAEVYIREIFKFHNARFFTGDAVAAVNQTRGKIRITLAGGSVLNTGLLVNAAGVRSRTSFLEGSGVKTGSGILVDSRMMTNVEGIYAAGDVAEGPDFFTGQPRVNAIVPSAIDQGRVAGANMAGQEVEYEGAIATTAFNFFENKAFSIGLLRDHTIQVFKEKDDRKRRFKKLVFSGDRLIGGMFLNEKIDPGIVLHLIKRRVDMTPYKEALFEGTRPLSDPWLSSLKFYPVNK